MVRQARLAESESTMEQLHNKLQQLEKSKDCNQKESDEMAASLDQAQLVNAALEKKVKQFGIYLFNNFCCILLAKLLIEGNCSPG